MQEMVPASIASLPVMLSEAKHPRAKHSTPQAAVGGACFKLGLRPMRFARGPFADAQGDGMGDARAGVPKCAPHPLYDCALTSVSTNLR